MLMSCSYFPGKVKMKENLDQEEISKMVNNRIKQLRLSKNLSQEQLAEKSKVSVRTIQRLEAGNEASIETLNLVAGALGVPVKELFDDSTAQENKIQNAEEKLHYQLQSRHDEFKTVQHLYSAGYIIVMLLWGVCFNFVHDNIWSAVMGVFWIGGWMLMGPLKKLIILKCVDPKLDAKYPLTASRIDKDREDK